MEWPDFYMKLAALACDGASMMTGCKAGVGALLRTKQPSLLTVHCMAHRLELALKDVSKKVKLYDKTVNTLAMGIYRFYYNSSLNRGMLRRAHTVLRTESDGDLLMPTRVGGTKWIGHTFRALTNLTASYKYICVHLGQVILWQ